MQYVLQPVHAMNRKPSPQQEKILNALRDYGVDNWEGYEMAMDSVEEE